MLTELAILMITSIGILLIPLKRIQDLLIYFDLMYNKAKTFRRYYFMAFMEIKLRSKVLGLCTGVNVILPEHRLDDSPLKVLWLLHGLSDDNTAWCRNTSIERYVENKNICVIMPAVDRSFYSDMVYGNKYYSYISAELPKDDEIYAAYQHGKRG